MKSLRARPGYALALLLSTAVLFPGPLGAADPPVEATLTILHTNDTHGHLLPFSYPSTPQPGSSVDGLPAKTDIGGIARRATLGTRIRLELEAQGTDVWLVDAGDFCDGTPFSTEYHGEADLAAMKACGYDFAVPGNHEFNNTLEQLRKLIRTAGYPILCANAVETKGERLLAPAYRIERVDDVKVAIFGLITHEAATYPAAREGVRIDGEVETARRMAAELAGEADILVLLSHCGNEMDQTLAREVPEIDVIVGGHSHSRLPSGQFIWSTEELRSDRVNGTIIVQAHQWGGELGRLDLLFARNATGEWQVDRYHARLLPITADLPPDPRVAAVVDSFWSPIAPVFGEVVGSAAADFCSRGDDRAEYNLVADAVRETFGTEIEMENLGGVRAPLVRGAITRGDLVTMDPFSNTIVLYEIRGNDLRRILERYSPAVSGLRYRVEDGRLLEASVNGEPLAEDRVYRGSANSYFAGFALKGIDLKDTGRKRIDVLTEYIRTKGQIQPAYDGRRIVLGGGSEE